MKALNKKIESKYEVLNFTKSLLNTLLTEIIKLLIPKLLTCGLKNGFLASFVLIQTIENIF